MAWVRAKGKMWAEIAHAKTKMRAKIVLIALKKMCIRKIEYYGRV